MLNLKQCLGSGNKYQVLFKFFKQIINLIFSLHSPNYMAFDFSQQRWKQHQKKLRQKEQQKIGVSTADAEDGAELILEHVVDRYNTGKFPLPNIQGMYDYARAELGLSHKDARVAVRLTTTRNIDKYADMGYDRHWFIPPGSENFRHAKMDRPHI